MEHNISLAKILDALIEHEANTGTPPTLLRLDSNVHDKLLKELTNSSAQKLVLHNNQLSRLNGVPIEITSSVAEYVII